MTRKQVAYVIGVNALISTLISIIVMLVFARPIQVGATPTPTSGHGQGPSPAVVGGSPTPTPEVVIHVVQSGDTISGLALQYDVPEADIIAANQLVNANFLQVGMELIIPVGGVPQATATFTPAPTPTDTPIPFEPPSADMTATAAAETGATAAAETAVLLPTPLPETGELQIEISEILAPGQIEQERVAITNLGARLADMQGWTLSDADGNVYTFPNFRLWAGGGVAVHTRVGQDGSPPANFYWGKLEAVWSTGEVATLKDAAGATISTYVVGP